MALFQITTPKQK